MPATFQQANTEILTVFKTAWDTTGWVAIYENVAGEIPDSEPWARVAVRHVTGQQATLTDRTGLTRYDREGTIAVQIFVPTGEGLTRSYQLSKIVADAYEGQATPSNVWFRDVRINEIGPDGSWFQTNVLIDFMYDEQK